MFNHYTQIIISVLVGMLLVQCKADQSDASRLNADTTETPIDSTISTAQVATNHQQKAVIVGAARFEDYLSELENKNVALLVNQTSVVNGEHLVDVLLEKSVAIKKIFAPEHGFRGTADAGATINNGRDSKTRLPIISLYGKRKKPYPSDLRGIDVVVFDIQDVGARFYTYISTMHYMMEACAENDVKFIVLDRPNPNGHYVDGPILKKDYKSFVGMHPVPIVHGMTVGEYAQMLNGEQWLKNGVQCALKVVKCQNYDHNTFYELPIKPSPNLPNIRSIYLYPSLCLFEGTVVSVGRGTATPFQLYGHPEYPDRDYFFVPQPTQGASNPKLKGKRCYGISLLEIDMEALQTQQQLNLDYIIDFYQKFPKNRKFFNSFFEKLAGTNELQRQIEQGMSADEIRASWQAGLERFKAIRANYLLY